MKQLQFELWQECGSNCTFCFLGSANKFTPPELKSQSLQNALDKISDLEIYNEYDTISYIGGEFFQGQLNTPEIKSKFIELMEKTAWLKDNGYVKQVWLYATMTIGDQKDLYETLDIFKNKEGLWILTSYDTLGRFHTQKMEETWKYNMKKIHELYPEIRMNITSIITGDLIEKYLNGDFSFKKFEDEYGCEFFLKTPYINGYDTQKEMNDHIGNFFPSRNMFLKFLVKIRGTEPRLVWDKLLNIKYRADELYKNYNSDDKQMVLEKRNKNSNIEETNSDGELLDCGHMDCYNIYSDYEGCAICDKKLIDDIY